MFTFFLLLCYRKQNIKIFHDYLQNINSSSHIYNYYRVHVYGKWQRISGSKSTTPGFLVLELHCTQTVKIWWLYLLLPFIVLQALYRYDIWLTALIAKTVSALFEMQSDNLVVWHEEERSERCQCLFYTFHAQFY